MKKFLIASAVIAAFVILGWIGHQDYELALLEQASHTCENQTNYSTPTYTQCIDNQLEQNGDK
jgi:predicted negative regulator of RcsB-dependent stress response